MRKRFNPCMICSSDNYADTRQAHINYLKDNQEERLKIIKEIRSQIITRKSPYVQIFDRLVLLTEDEVKIVRETMKVIWK